MKIFLVSNMYPSNKFPVYGIFVYNFEKGLNKFGVDFSTKAIIKGKTENKLYKIIKYLRLYKDIIFNGLFYKYDLIYIHYPTLVSIPLFFFKLLNKKIIINFHGDDLYYSKIPFISSLLLSILRKLSNIADLIVVPSPYFKSEVIKYMNVKENNIYISPSGGVNTNIFKPIERKNLLEKYKLEDNTFIIGFVSRITEGKGWRIYLNALKLLMNNYPVIKFKGIIVGHGEDEELLKKEINTLKLENNVTYLGHKSQSELPEIYNLMDIFIFPSIRKDESLGLVAIESFSCSIPVIASNFAGMKDYVKDNYNGMLFTLNDHEELCEKIIKYYNLSDEDKLVLKKNALETSKSYETSIISEKLFKKLEEFI